MVCFIGTPIPLPRRPRARVWPVQRSAPRWTVSIAPRSVSRCCASRPPRFPASKRLQQVSLELAEREKGLIPGDTAEQAQAQLLQIVKRVAQQQMPPLEVGQVELGRPRTFGSAYGQVSVSITVTCRIEDLVNFLAALSAQPELTGTEEIRFGTSHPKLKTMPIRLTVSGLVARRLVPVQKGSDRVLSGKLRLSGSGAPGAGGAAVLAIARRVDRLRTPAI